MSTESPPAEQPPASTKLNILFNSDIISALISEGVDIATEKKSFSANRFGENVAYNVAARLLQKYVTLPNLPLLTTGNIAAGAVAGLDYKFRKGKTNQQALQKTLNSAISNILGSELTARAGIPDQALI